MKNKNVYWYLRLPYTTLSDPKIQRIERISESKFGEFFPSFIIHIYFKLLCYSTPTDGLIRFDPIYEENEDLAYSVAVTLGFPEKFKKIRQVLIILKEFDLIDVIEMENETQIYIPFVTDNTGKTTLSSEERRMRRIKAKNKNKSFLQIETNDDDTTANSSKTYGTFKNVILEQKEYEYLKEKCGYIDNLIEFLSIQKEIGRSGYVKNDYAMQSDYESLVDLAEAR